MRQSRENVPDDRGQQFSAAKKKLWELLLSTALGCAALEAQGFDASNYITGDWGGARATLADRGVDSKLGYFSEGGYNLSGGERTATAYADQIFLGAYLDLGKLLSWPGAQFKVEITDRNGDLINNKAGMPFLLQSQQIFGRGDVVRLTQFSLTQKLFDDHLSIKGGRLYPDADFFAMSCSFQHLTFCSGGSSNYINSGWYGDPLSALGAQITITPDEHWYFKLGGYDTNPNTLSRNQKLRITTPGGPSHALVVGELEYKADYGGEIDGDYRVGAVRNNSSSRKLVNEAGFPAGLTADPVASKDTENSFFINLEQQVWRNAAGGGLRLFASFIGADAQVRSVAQVLAVGGFIKAPFASREHDRAGLAFGRNAVSSYLTAAQRLYDASLPAGATPVGVQRYEYPVELNYNIALTPAVEIMPSIQYVWHPNGLTVGDATVVGLQVSLNF